MAGKQGLLSEMPFVGNTINSCYWIGAASAKANTGSPPPLIVKLLSSETRINILNCKREATFGPNQAEKELGIKFFSILFFLIRGAHLHMQIFLLHFLICYILFISCV